MVSRVLERSLIGFNIVVLLLAGYVTLREGGPGRQAWDQWRELRRQAAFLRNSWGSMAAAGSDFGNQNGTRVLVEFSDYQCGFCRRAHNSLMSMVGRDTSLRVVLRHFPLPDHPLAQPAAAAAICAAEQGRFEAMHRRLFETDDWQRDSNWAREAAAAAVPDTIRFSNCLRAPTTQRRIRADVAMGESLRVAGTPTFLTRDRRITGFKGEVELQSLLQ